MKREQKQTKHVKRGYIIALKCVNHHRVNVLVSERIRLKAAKTWIGHSYCEMRQVINAKHKHDQPAHHHVTRGEVGLDVMPIKVAFWPRAAIFNGQLNRDIDVNDDRREQQHADCPKQRPEVTKVLRVIVNPIWTQKNLEIAEQMSDNEDN